MSQTNQPDKHPSPPATWFDAFVATLPPERVRTVTKPDGSTHLSIEMREGAIVDALRDAMRHASLSDLTPV
jgi:hypothetical protein